jgi:hypothetical protein
MLDMLFDKFLSLSSLNGVVDAVTAPSCGGAKAESRCVSRKKRISPESSDSCLQSRW